MGHLSTPQHALVWDGARLRHGMACNASTRRHYTGAINDYQYRAAYACRPNTNTTLSSSNNTHQAKTTPPSSPQQPSPCNNQPQHLTPPQFRSINIAHHQPNPSPYRRTYITTPLRNYLNKTTILVVFKVFDTSCCFSLRCLGCSLQNKELP